jgi:F-box and WD-40 domain protein 1/11
LQSWKAVAGQDDCKFKEEKVNEGLDCSSGQLLRFFSADGGHAVKKRAISGSPKMEMDRDHAMIDANRPLKQEPVEDENTISLFGDAARSGMTPSIGELNMDSSGSSWSSKIDTKGKGKGKARDLSGLMPPRIDSLKPDSAAIRADSLPDMLADGTLQRSTLWMWDSGSSKYRLNWKHLYSMRRRLESNWEAGRYINLQFPHPDHPEEGHGECIYSIQFNPKYLVSGSRDKTIRVWDMRTRRLVRPPLTGHRGSVLCLQFDSDPEEDLIASGSSDSDIILWRFSTGQIIQRLSRAHRESVLNVKFDKNILVTCSKDKTIKIFNRRPLKPGDLGYGDVAVDPVPIHLRNNGYDLLPEPQIKPAFSLLCTLDGHGAAVNAVQISGREIVSASGDRHVRIWDWPTGNCLRVFLGHNKGIACVQYDGKRVVSGSSDNEVKIFDRHSGIEVASLKSHTSLVRTVQAGFGDMPHSAEEDAAEAARVDAQYFQAVESGTITPNAATVRRRNGSGSGLAKEIMAVGAKLPPGGGGGKYGRIISGSYDATIIIWRRDKKGVWKAQHTLRQEEAAAAAAPPPARAAGMLTAESLAEVGHPPVPAQSLPIENGQPASSSAAATSTVGGPLSGLNGSNDTPFGPVTSEAQESLGNLIDLFVPQGVQMLQQALASYPTMLTMQTRLQAAIDREHSPFVRSQLRQTVSTALVRAQIAHARARQTQNSGLGISPTAAGPSHTNGSGSRANSGDNSGGAQLAAGPSFGSVIASPLPQAQANPTGIDSDAEPTSQEPTAGPSQTAVTGAPPPATLTNPGPVPAARQVAHHPHATTAADAANAARVFKLQFDAQRIICCSQTSTIVVWDFCNGDRELEEAARFFAPIE